METSRAMERRLQEREEGEEERRESFSCESRKKASLPPLVRSKTR